MIALEAVTFDYQFQRYSTTQIIHADCFEWMGRVPANSVHAIVTDPPYGVKEYDFNQIEKRANGNGGIWRIPPSFDGSNRAPLPRFTALNQKERDQLYRFFLEWARLAVHALCQAATSSSPATPSCRSSSSPRSSPAGWSSAASLSALSAPSAAAIVRRTPKTSSPMCARCHGAATSHGVSSGNPSRRG
ncbi:MAG TPA: hypothetical protein VNL77_24840 [Roseiflexaceae bacterium]|nr:hypothetical protein [Roseiflexaceae bacterium]